MQLPEFPVLNSLAAAVSAGLFLLAAWLFLRSQRRVPDLFRRGQDGWIPTFLVRPPDGSSRALALIASLFVHLIALSLVPFFTLLGPEAILLPARPEFVIIEYRPPPGVGRLLIWDSGPAGDGSAEQAAFGEPSAPAPPPEDLPRERATRSAARAQESREDPPQEHGLEEHNMEARDLAIVRFESVIQLSRPAAPPRDNSLDTLGASPALVLDWQPRQVHPNRAVMGAFAGLAAHAAALERWKPLPEFSARERFVLPKQEAAPARPEALAAYDLAGSDNSPAAAIRFTEGPVRSPRFPDEALVEYGEFTALRLHLMQGRRSLPFLIAVVLAPSGPPGPFPPALEFQNGPPVAPNPAGTRAQAPPTVPAGPSPAQGEPRRHGVILIRTSDPDQIPGAEGWLTGNPVYTIYLSVAGSRRKWVLQFCRPAGAAAGMKISNGVIRILPRRRISPPFPRRTEPLRLAADTASQGTKAVAVMEIEPDGAITGLRLVAGPGGDAADQILASLRAWEFQPALQDGKPVGVEAVLGIPLD